MNDSSQAETHNVRDLREAHELPRFDSTTGGRR